MDASPLTRPSGVTPVVMSMAALSIVVGHASTFGVAPQADGGTAAHL
jgi:hypothetical protein